MPLMASSPKTVIAGLTLIGMVIILSISRVAGSRNAGSGVVCAGSSGLVQRRRMLLIGKVVSRSAQTKGPWRPTGSPARPSTCAARELD
jgi:hypothetical protein